MKLQGLLDFHGRVGRSTYALTVISAALVLHNLLRILTATLFLNQRGSSGFLFPIRYLYAEQPLSADLKRALSLLVLVAVPFLWLLVTMTVKRLRDLETTEWYAFLLFVPAVNILFFLILCLQPGNERMEESERRKSSFLDTFLPASSLGSAAVGALVGALTATVISWFSIAILGIYGSTLFLALPCFMGYMAAWIHGYRRPRSAGECYVVAMASIVLTAALVVGIAFEGIICVAMATPLAIPLALLGGHLAYLSQKSRALQAQPSTMLSLLLALPLLVGAESWKPAPIPQHIVHSSVEIAAPPQIVWRRIVAFPKIKEKPHWILRLGMAYPMEATTTGSGLSADRQTAFSTGISREPILAWEEGKHLAFRVAEEPPLMNESSPYGTIHVRHLDDHDFRPGRVDFYLTDLSGGRTKLDCWSSYENRMWPSAYWQLWTNEIVRQIQLRVFRQVKTLSEADSLPHQANSGRKFVELSVIKAGAKTQCASKTLQ